MQLIGGTVPDRLVTALISTVLALAVSTTAGCTHRRAHLGEVPGTGQPARWATVVDVSDGDTIEVRFDDGPVERVRLLGIDTPETVHPDRPVECWGPEASARTRALTPPGSEVLVRRDQEVRDRFGRLLLYVWRSDGLFVNATLLAEGHARTMFFAPNHAHRAELSAAAAEARRQGLGLWVECPDEG